MLGWYQALTPSERARFLLGRYMYDGYLQCVNAWGKLDAQLKWLIKDAEASIAARHCDELRKTGRAIFAIKAKGVP